MSSAVAPAGLAGRLATLDPAILAHERRLQAFEQFSRLPSRRERTGRYWRIDLETLTPDPAADVTEASPRIDNPNARIIACDLRVAATEHPAEFALAFGKTEIGSSKFGALARAFAQGGAFVYVPANVAATEPVVIDFDFAPGTAAFAYTVVYAAAGSEVTVIERYGGAPAFACGATEIVTDENATVTFANHQSLTDAAQCVHSRFARPGKDATVHWACADTGAALTVGEIAVAIEHEGVDAGVTSIFFPNGTQHVDLVARLDHTIGNSVSDTVVKSAATGSGQARFVGSIRIAERAQGSNAALRDDALLLSERAHIDSVPALEIAANDVKAYHGATVGALDGDQIFYMQSRGIAAADAERMIAIAFFEPAIERFPTQSLRSSIRDAVEAKLG